MEKKKVLIANGGLCAYKFLLDNYFLKKKFIFIGLVRPADLKNKMQYVDFLDQYELVEDGHPDKNFNNLNLILSIARKYSVDYVWPGYGHLSENYLLPQALEEMGIKFVGPSSSAMKILGNKISANQLAQKLDIPTVPHMKITKQEDLEKFAQQFKFPLMIRKANEGGGRGITYIENEKDIADYDYMDSRNIFAIKYLKNVRHIEVQGVADRKNNITILDSRDCTLQRRYQKLMEEAPQIICDENIVEKMKSDSVKLLRDVQYEGLATIEWLYDLDSGNYYFLEVNCRLQVEHPCTEILYGIKLCSLQLKIASGHLLRKMSFSKKNIHVTSARILAENYLFMAQTGEIFIDFSILKNVKYYFAFSRGVIDEVSDSQFGHIFAVGKTRRKSLKLLYKALSHVKIEGIESSIFFNRKILRNKNYRENDFNTKSAEKFLIVISFKKLYFFPIIYFLRKQITNLNFIYENEEFSSEIYFLNGNRLICNLNNQYTYHTYVEVGSNIVLIDNEYVEYQESKEYYRLKYRKLNLVFYFNRADQIAKNSFKLLKYYVENNQWVKKGDKLLLTESMKTEQNFYAPFDGVVHKIKMENDFVRKDEKYCTIASSNKNDTVYEQRILIEDSILASLTVESIESFYFPSVLFNFNYAHKYFYFLHNLTKIKNCEAFNEYVRIFADHFIANINKDRIIQMVLENNINVGLELLFKKIKIKFILKKKRKNYILKTTADNFHTAIAFIKTCSKKNIILHVKNNISIKDSHKIENIKKIKIFTEKYVKIIENNFTEELVYENNVLVKYTVSGIDILINNNIRKLIKHRKKINSYLFYFLLKTNEKNYEWKINRLFYKEKGKQIVCGIDGYLITINRRKIIFVINNREIVNGSMGQYELKFYAWLTDYAVEINAMRIFIANNSGVRISIDQYFLENYAKLKNENYAIDSGNESLCYAALACKSTIKAREHIPLITYVHNMSVGIGAYLARLGGQIIMEKDSSLILTGYRALNKLMQEERYMANTDVGGSDIMVGNNICQVVVNNFFEGSAYLFNYINLLYFTSNCKNTYPLEKCTAEHELIEYLSNNTFVEFSKYYGQTVHVGRAVIHSRCFGIIYPEKPNVIDCKNAIKMRKALEIFSSENIPTLIIGNFKGFTGDHKEMSHGILTFGADLITAIEKYRSSLFIYIPAFGQLRGGSYVIFDKKLNENIILIADEKSKIGILQPDGLKDVKRGIGILGDQADEYINQLDDPLILLRKNLISEVCKAGDLKRTIKKYL